VTIAPNWHLRLEIVLDLLGHLLEEDTSSPPASGARGHLRRESTQFDRRQALE
jgi:hypothetical protein